MVAALLLVVVGGLLPGRVMEESDAAGADASHAVSPAPSSDARTAGGIGGSGEPRAAHLRRVQ